jgi:hypothetical protein
MNEITKQSDMPPVAEKIQDIETEILPLEIQNIDAPLAPEIISGVQVNEETDSKFRPLTEITELYIYRIWPGVVIAFGLTLTAAWICLLGYALVKIIEMAI